MTDNAEFPNQVHRKLQAGFPFLDCVLLTHMVLQSAMLKQKARYPDQTQARLSLIHHVHCACVQTVLWSG